MKKIIIVSFLFSFFIHNLYSKSYELYPMATIQVLNKLTGKYQTLEMRSDNIYTFDNDLYIVLKKCYKSSQSDEVENAGFFEVMKTLKKDNVKNNIEQKNNDVRMPIYFKNIDTQLQKKLIFSGWIFSSSPSLSYLEDNIYDIMIISCSIPKK